MITVVPRFFMPQVLILTHIFLKGVIRDKILRVLVLSGLGFLVLAPFVSFFSMRQVHQLLITITLSWISLNLLFLTLMLGSSSIWKDMEKRWLYAVFGLPVKRSSYVISRLLTIIITLAGCGVALAGLGALLIAVVGDTYSTALDFTWGGYWVACAFMLLKYMLLTAIVLLFSSVSTSLFLPVFGTFSVYLAGSASQGVMDYVTGVGAPQTTWLVQVAAKALYYLLPNFSVFDLTTAAIYGLPIDFIHLLWVGGYFVVYTSLVIWVAVVCFNQRELK